MDTTFDVAIVGGGLSGIATLYHLSKCARASSLNLTCILLESSGQLGGLAYCTSSNTQILNVPAGKMGIDEEAAGDFGVWLTQQGLEFSADAFVPRHLYRRYLNYVIDRVSAEGSVRLSRATARVDGVRVEEGRALLLADGEIVARASQVIIAVGNSLAPEPVSPPSAHPWRAADLQHASGTRSVAIIGSSLSAVDVILDLESRGFSGRHTVMSRRGLFPCEHMPATAQASLGEFTRALSECSTVRDLVHTFRECVARGAEWRPLLDAMRGETPRIWGALSNVEKRRFVRHVRPYWDIHRHRIPQESHQVLRELMASGRLAVQKRRFVSASQSERGVMVESRCRGALCREEFDVVFDCRGLWTDLVKQGSPFVQSVITQGLGQVDSLRMGFVCDSTGRLLGSAPNTGAALYTLGSLRRGELWESTAARELRIQAGQIAASVVRDLTARAKYRAQ
jgi:uncharacterized NAD(P)/FAD-binding protein YdhS